MEAAAETGEEARAMVVAARVRAAAARAAVAKVVVEVMEVIMAAAAA